MPNLIRHTVVWTGAPGLPGYSQFYQESTGEIAAQAQQGHDDIGVFFGGLESLIPEEVTVTPDPVYQVVDIATGALVGEGSVGTPGPAVAGLMVGGWNAQMGILVEWLTGDFIGRGRVRGRTYLVPLGELSQADGTVPEATLTTVRAWAAFIISGGHGFAVWHRPVNGAGGQVATITGLVVRDHACVLRSRMV